MKITDWAHDIICGPGGLLDFRDREGAYYRGCEGKEHPERLASEMCWAAYWAVKCLTSPEQVDMLKAVVDEAAKRQQKPEVPE